MTIRGRYAPFSIIDIATETNLSATTPIVLTESVLSFLPTVSVDWNGQNITNIASGNISISGQVIRTGISSNQLHLAADGKVGIGIVPSLADFEVSGKVYASDTVTGFSVDNRGVIGASTNSIGVFGSSINDDAGYFAGDVTITGDAYIDSDITISAGSITSASLGITFGNENLSTTGTFSSGTATIDSTLHLSSSSITDDNGLIDLSDDHITTTGNGVFDKIGAGASVNTSYAITSVNQMASSSFMGGLVGQADNTIITGGFFVDAGTIYGLNFLSRYVPSGLLPKNATVDTLQAVAGGVVATSQPNEIKNITVTEAIGFETTASIFTRGAGSSGTMNVVDFYHFKPVEPTLVNGFTITNQYGFYDPGLTGATNDWGIAINTPNNYINGRLRIGDTTAPTDALEVNGASVVGDGGTDHYTQFSATGYQTMHGSAKVKLTTSFTFQHTIITAHGKPTQVSRGVFNGFSLPVYNNDNEELFTCECAVPEWDGVTDPVVHLGGWLDTANNAKKFNLQVSVETADFDNNEVLPITTNDYTIETTTGNWAQYTGFKVQVTLDASVIGLTVGKPLAIRVRRIAASTDEIAGEVVIEGAIVEITADKIGGAV